MRTIKHIVIHCSATRAGKYFNAKDIDRWHRERGWNGIGYHYVILLDGTIELGRDVSKQGAHVKGYNKHSIGICYIGGLDAHGKPKDTRTLEQKISMFCLLQDLKDQYITADILGHRDFSEDQNRNGIIEPFEFIKYCPCFNAKEEYKNLKNEF